MKNTKTNKTKREALRASPRPVAAEDLKRGDFIAVADEDVQLVPPMCDDALGRFPARALRLAYIPCDAGTPRKVLRVAPPFVLVREPNGNCDTLDLRLTRLLRLDRAYAAEAFRRLDYADVARRRKRRAKRRKKDK